MLETLLVKHVWLAILLWAALYCSDYGLTLRAARLYHAGVNQYFVFEGSYELTPYYQKDIDDLRRLSLRFVWALGLSILALAAVGALALGGGLPELFSFLIGGLLLMELTIHIRHLRNLTLFKSALAGGVTGKIEYRRGHMLRGSAIELFSFAGLYFILFLVAGSAFILGGSVTCFATGMRHWLWARKFRPA